MVLSTWREGNQTEVTIYVQTAVEEWQQEHCHKEHIFLTSGLGTQDPSGLFSKDFAMLEFGIVPGKVGVGEFWPASTGQEPTV